MDCDVYLNPYVLVSGSVKSSKEDKNTVASQYRRTTSNANVQVHNFHSRLPHP
jgi:hypothetical protein